MERFKFWTDGEKHLVFLGITKCGKADEGNYRCVLTNRFGNREHKFKLFVSSECGVSSYLDTQSAVQISILIVYLPSVNLRVVPEERSTTERG